MKLCLLSSLLLLCLPIVSFSQFTMGGISAQGGIGYVTHQYHFEDSMYITYDNKPAFSFQLGFFATYKLTQKSGLEAELTGLLQQGHTEGSFSGESEGHFSATSRFIYLTLPLRYSYSIHNFSFMGGPQLGLYLHGWQPTDFTSYSPWALHRTYVNTGPGLVKTFDFGLTLAAQRKICDRLFVTVTAFHSIINLVPVSGLDGNTIRNANVMLGVRYSIFPKADAGN